MKTNDEVKEFIEFQLTNDDYTEDFIELDSLDKIDLVVQCENEFNIIIDDIEYESIRNSNTKGFIDFIIKKIEENN
jgi:acyl carrier protein